MSIVSQFKPEQVQEEVDSATQLSFHVRTHMYTCTDSELWCMKQKLVMNAVSGGILFQIKFESLGLSEVKCSNFIVSWIVNI